MIARNFIKYPEALALQLQLRLVHLVDRIVRERHNASPERRKRPEVVGEMEAGEIPIGSIVQTPTGKKARVLGYRGKRRDHRERLWCQYLEPENKRFDKVLLVPELVKVIERGDGR